MVKNAVSYRGYEIIEEIGAGGFGVVYRAHQTAANRDVAVKIILSKYADQPEFAARFDAEAQMVAGLEHPHIVPLYDTWTDEDGAHLVMRLLRGGSLKDLLASGPLEPENIVEIVRQVASALDAAHRQGVIHRDLKPSNILFDGDGNAYLSDFGIAKNLEAEITLTPTGAILGSPAYMAPEQIRGEKLTNLSDVYSLGALIYELLTDRPPFSDLETTSLLYKQLHEPLPLVTDTYPELPAAVDLVIQQATAKNQYERYGSAALMPSVRPVEAILQPEAITLPSFLKDAEIAGHVKKPIFVGREQELEWLNEQFNSALQNQGRVLFVTGEAGQGKTALLQAFAEQATESNPDLLVAWGQCNAFSGRGDPYLPFREIFAQLSGDVEGPYRSGLLNDEESKRLWLVLPDTADTLRESGSSLLNTFIPVNSLLKRLNEAAPQDIALHNRLGQLIRGEQLSGDDGTRSQLFEQVVRVLDKMSAEHPLLLVIDDLQWVDHGSIDMLFHLGRSLPGKRILIIAAYRPEDIAAGRDGQQHPLKPLVNEFRRLYGDITLDLSQSEGRTFVEAFVDSEPNNLGSAFRSDLFLRTGGHPLFTVELLRDLQERGDLVLDEEGRWIATEHLDWEALPVRVEGVIESRIGRLEESLREILTVASVEGESFTASVVAKIQQVQERQLLRSLSRELEARHRLVEERQTLTVRKQLLARYRFAHAIFQRYFYNDITQVERRLLHQEIAAILEDIYGNQSDKIAVQLARHFVESGSDEKAIVYLLMAGDQARHIYANQEAIEHYRAALSLAEAHNQHDRAARILMKMGLTYTLAFEFVRASEAYREAFAAWQRASTATVGQRLPMSPEPLRIEFRDPGDLDPRNATEIDRDIVLQLFSGLVRITPEGDVLPDVAERWDVIDNGLTYVFHLRSDVYWSDGCPVSAYDFEYAWRRSLDPDFSGTAVYFFHDIRGARAFHSREISQWKDVGIRAEDEKTLVVELEAPVGTFLQLISEVSLFPVPRHVVENQGDEWASSKDLVSNGPFLLESWERRKSMTLVRNPKYHGYVNGNVGRIVMRYIRNLREQEDVEGLMALYESNQVDILGLSDISPEIAETIARRYAEDYITAPSNTTASIFLSPDKPPLDDVKVRRALAMAIDKEAFARHVVGSMNDLATGGLVPPGLWGHSPGISLPFDPDQARILLKESGYRKASDFSQVVALYTPTRTNETLFPIQNWRQHLGLKISPQLLSYKDFHQYIDQVPPHIYLLGWIADYPDPDNFLRTAIHRTRSRWNHPRFEELIERARHEIDHSKRSSLYREADKILIDEAVVIPLVYARRNLLVKPWIYNHRLSGTYVDSFEDIIIADH
jgi:ABC-type oligopeptide transport system substrate-binding subunit/serine/threonine protein kinase